MPSTVINNITLHSLLILVKCLSNNCASFNFVLIFIFYKKYFFNLGCSEIISTKYFSFDIFSRSGSMRNPVATERKYSSY